MPTDFRLSYTNGIEYIDLFPQTSIEGIIDSNNIYNITTLNVTVPSLNTPNITKIISINTTPSMINSPFQVILNSTTEQDELDFLTINQIQVINNQLVITRLYNMPVNSINITLLFFEKKENT